MTIATKITKYCYTVAPRHDSVTIHKTTT